MRKKNDQSTLTLTANSLQDFQQIAVSTRLRKIICYPDGEKASHFIFNCCDSVINVRYSLLKVAEFIRRARRYSRRSGLEFQYDPRRGKGSHGRVFLGERLTAIKSANKTIGIGLLRKMLKDLDINPKDF